MILRSPTKSTYYARHEMLLKPTLRIVFCDDDQDELVILKTALEDAGYLDAIVYACTFSGKELLDALVEQD